MMPDKAAPVPAGSELFISAREALSGDTQKSARARVREIWIIAVNVTTSVPTGLWG